MCPPGDSVWGECRGPVSGSPPNDAQQPASLQAGCPAEPPLLHPLQDKVAPSGGGQNTTAPAQTLGTFTRTCHKHTHVGTINTELTQLP